MVLVVVIVWARATNIQILAGEGTTTMGDSDDNDDGW